MKMKKGILILGIFILLLVSGCSEQLDETETCYEMDLCDWKNVTARVFIEDNLSITISVDHNDYSLLDCNTELDFTGFDDYKIEYVKEPVYIETVEYCYSNEEIRELEEDS